MKNINYLKNKYILFAFALIIFFSFSFKVHAESLIITEVQYDVSGSESEAEWIELFNPTDKTIDITDWTLTEGIGNSFIFPSGTVLAPGGYMLITNDTSSFQVDFPGVVPDVDMGGPGCYTETECLRLNNSRSSGSINADEITMRDNLGEVIDYVQWETTIANLWPIQQTAGNSICRVSSIDTDLSDDWLSECDESPGSGNYTIIFTEPKPKTTNSTSRSGRRIRLVCNDPQALNFANTRFGRHSQFVCRY
jgi:hypothetical protein